LPHELLGKVRGANVPLVELFRDRRIFPGKLLKRTIDLFEQRPILNEELLCDSFNAEGFFDLAKSRGRLGILK